MLFLPPHGESSVSIFEEALQREKVDIKDVASDERSMLIPPGRGLFGDAGILVSAFSLTYTNTLAL